MAHPEGKQSVVQQAGVAPEAGKHGAGGSATTAESSKPFERSQGLTSEKAKELLALHGRNELPEDRLPSWRIFLNGLIGVMPVWKVKVSSCASFTDESDDTSSAGHALGGCYHRVRPAELPGCQVRLPKPGAEKK